MSTKSVRGVRTFQYAGQLRIADTGLQSSCTDTSRSNTAFDDISTAENQFFDHFTCHDIAGLR